VRDNTEYLKAEADAASAAISNVGLVHIATVTLSGSSVNIVGCFSSTYQEYVITTRANSSADAFLNFRLLDGTTAITTNYLARNIRDDTSLIRATSTTQVQMTGANNGSTSWFLVSGPNLAANTFGSGHGFATSSTETFISLFSFRHTLSTAYTGCQFFVTSGTISGSASVFGVKKL
jgi:hypothetical protein